jgi:hypothetical protein
VRSCVKAPLTEVEFAALATRAGLQLTAEKRAELYEAFGAIETLAARIRQPRDLGAEPATIFTLVVGEDAL